MDRSPKTAAAGGQNAPVDTQHTADVDPLDAELRSALQHSPDHVLLVDASHRVTFFNRLAPGFTAEEVLGTPAEAFVPESSREMVRDAIDSVFRTAEPTAYEVELVTPQGTRWFHTRLGPVVRDGRVHRVATFATDVSESKRRAAEAALEHAYLGAVETINRAVVASATVEETIAAALEATLDVFDCDRAFLITPCDPEASHWSVAHQHTRPGWATETGVARPMNPELARTMRSCLRRRGAYRRDPDHAPLEPDHVLRTHYGVQAQLMMAIYPHGSTPWLFGVHHCRQAVVYGPEVRWFENIGARLADALTSTFAQQALRESEERFRALFEFAPDAVVILDTETMRFVDVNANAVKLFGASKEELTRQGPMDLSPALQTDGTPSPLAAAEPVQRALAGESVMFEWTHQNAQGEPIPCEVRIVPFPHGGRRLVRGTVTDISERKRAEREREALNEQLAQAQKMQAIGQLTGGVAHDFNNLLTVITSSLSMVEMHAGDRDQVTRFAAHAGEAAERAADLTRRLLAFAKKQPLRPRPIDLNALVRNLQGLLHRSLGEGVRVRLQLDESLWPCEVDSGQLESALLNLAINARDAMPGGGALTIETSNEHRVAPAPDAQGEPAQYVALRVRDEGHGMSPEVRQQAFEPFFTTKEVRRGTGLGLSMVYGFVQQSGGLLHVDSEVGRGTTVELCLPRSNASPQPPVATTAPPREALEGNGERVLVLEDDPGVRQVTVSMLRQLGYETLDAATVEKADALLADHPDVQLLLSDVVLGGPTTGPEFARSVRETRPELPVVFMSGHAHDALRGSRLDPEFTLLQKPFPLKLLARTLRDALRDP